MRKGVERVGLLLAALAMVMVSAPARAGVTLGNLQAAYNGESNARLKYMAYAKQADQEGYARVAQLFRAAARAEGLHASNHSKVIAKLGATAANKIATPAPKSTLENLRDAVKGETYERDVMYPDFLAAAEKENQDDAFLTFAQAKSAEAEHARLYQLAIDTLPQWNTAVAGFWVCPTCGYTTETAPAKDCPVCSTGKEKYLLVS